MYYESRIKLPLLPIFCLRPELQTTRRSSIEINVRVVCIVQQATATTITKTTRAIVIASRIIIKTFLHFCDKDKLIPAILAINAAPIQIQSLQ